MKQFIFIIILTSIFGFSAHAQDSTDVAKTKQKQVDITGNFLIDFGFNLMTNEPEELQTKFFGSKTVNLYYYYNIPFKNGHFSFNPGIGLGLERFKFDENITLTNVLVDGQEEIQITSLSNLYAGASVKNTKLIANYLDIPIEFRYYLDKNNPNEGFRAAIGGKIGYLIGSHTKVKYSERGDTKISKQKGDYNLETLRGGVYARVGFPGINLYGYYSLTDLFKADKGPLKTTASTFNIGISISGF